MIGHFLYYLLILFELLVAMFVCGYSVSLLFSFLKGTPYISTQKGALQTILAEAQLKPGQLFIELGCGDGRVVREAVEQYKVNGIGIDVNPTLIYLAQLRAKKLDNIKFIKEDISKTDLTKADVVYFFFLPTLITKLEAKLNKELKANALVISHGFKIPSLEKYFTKQIDGKFKTYFYRIARRG